MNSECSDIIPKVEFILKVFFPAVFCLVIIFWEREFISSDNSAGDRY